MLLNGRVLFTLLMLTVFVTMVVVALGFPPDSRFAPLVIGIPGIVLTLGQLIADFLDTRRSPPGKRREPGLTQAKAQAGATPAGSVVKRELVMFAYVFGLVAGVVLFGFWIAIPVFILVFLRLHERESWSFTLLLTAAGTAVLYLVFDRMLSIILHDGFVTRAVLDRLGG